MSEDVKIRAARAEQLMEDEVLLRALSNLRDDAWWRAVSTSLSAPEKCIGALAAIQATSDFESRLKEFITDGKAAERKPYKVA